MLRASAASWLVLLLAQGCAGSGPTRPDSGEVAVTVLTSRGCGQTDAAVEQVERVASRSAIPIRLERVVVETEADAQRLHLLGSPTFLIEGKDLDPAARDRTDYGFS